MLYQNYRQRMQKLSEILKTIKRFSALIITIAAVIFAVSFGLVFSNGMIYSVEEIPNEVTYGDSSDIYASFASAVFGSVSYEYKEEGTDDWIKGTPSRAGTYSIRAVSTRSFGIPTYSEPKVFTIKPRPVDIFVPLDTLMYGDLPTVSASLEFEDIVECSEYDYDDPSLQSTRITPNINSVRVIDKYGEDVTSSYSISVLTTDITFIRRAITITTNDATAVYDGTALTEWGFAVTEGSLAGEDECQPEFKNSLTTVGTIQNEAEISIINSDGIDVSANYEITIIAGSLTVESRPIDISTFDNKREYDATPLSSLHFEISEQTLLPDGHTIELIEFSQLTDVGSCDNILKFRILDANANDVTSSFSFTIGASKLEILHKAVIIRTDSGTKVYDGMALEVEGFKLEEGFALVDGHVATLDFSGSQIWVGVSDNSATLVSIIMDDGESQIDVTNNYDVQIRYGELSVEQRKIGVTTATDSRVYNGKPQTLTDYAITEGELAPNQSALISEKTLAYMTDVGTISNCLRLHIVDADLLDVTECYDISYEEGDFTITARPIVVMAQSAQFMYDGEEHSHKGHDIVEGTSLAFGHSTEVDSFFSVRDVMLDEQSKLDSIKNHITVRVLEGEVDRTLNYYITYAEPGTLTVTPRIIRIETATSEWFYDGLEHFDISCEATAEGYTAIVEGQQIEVFDYATIKNVIWIAGAQDQSPSVGSMENWLELGIFSGERETTLNYQIDLVFGELTIHPRQITVESATTSWMYDGVEHFDYSHIFTQDTSLAEGQGSEVTEYVTITDVQRDQHSGDVVGIPNDITIIIMCADEETTDNYLISYIAGTLTVTPRLMTIETASNEWMYDGEVHFDKGYQIITEAKLVDGHEIEIVEYISLIDVMRMGDNQVGSTKNEFIILIKEGETDKSANYLVEFKWGDIRITPRPITIETYSKEFMYDGGVHSHVEFDVVSSIGLVEGHEAVESQYESIQEVIRLDGDLIGSINNRIDIIIKADDTDYTPNYDIEYIYGTLTVTPRPISILSITDSWVYDGYIQSGASFDVVGEYDLILGHNYVFVEYVTIKDVIRTEDGIGSITNTLLLAVYEGDYDKTFNYDITYSYGELTVYPREVKFATATNEWMYDGLEHFDNGFWLDPASAYNLADDQYSQLLLPYTTITDVLWEQDEVVSKDNILKIAIYFDGIDVSDNYEISYNYGTLKITPRIIEVVTATREWEYDGQWHYDDIVQTSISLGENDELIVDGYTSIRDVKWHEGAIASEENIVTFGIFRGELDVMSNYSIVVSYGTLTILPRALSIATGSSSWMYDGQEHYDNSTSQLYGTSLASGHYIEVTYYPTITDVKWLDGIVGYANGGVVDRIVNSLDFEIRGGDGDLSSNYEITVEYGWLKILPRSIVVETSSLNEMYDGNAHSNAEYTVVGEFDLVFGHYLDIAEDSEVPIVTDVIWTGENVGSRDNEFAVVVKIGENNISANYDILYIYGTLTIRPREITLLSGSGEWDYDGQTHYSHDYEIISVHGFVENHQLKVVRYAEITDVEWLDGQVHYVDNDLTVEIVDGEDDKTSNYSISYESGTLKILPRKITVITHDYTSVYDGYEHFCESFEISSLTELVAGHEAIVLTNTSIRDVQWQDGEISSLSNALVVGIVTIDGQENKSPNYYIEYVYGTLTLTPLEITITSGTSSHIYDGTFYGDQTISTSVDLGYEDEIRVDEMTLVMNVLREDNKPDGTPLGVENCLIFSIVSHGEDKTSNYIINKEWGTITILPREVTITTATTEWEYDGQYHLDKSHWTQGDMGIVQGQISLVTIHTEIRDVIWENDIIGEQNGGIIGKTSNILELIILSEGIDVSYNYSITMDYGWLSILPREIEIETLGFINDVLYDAKLHGSDEYIITKGELASNQYSRVFGRTLVSDVKWNENGELDGYQNELQIEIVDDNDVDVSSNYTITYRYGLLIIQPRQLVIATDDGDWLYDGQYHSAEGFRLESGDGYVVGHLPTIDSFTKVKDVNWVDGQATAVSNDLVISVINAIDGANVSHNYAISYAFGELLVRPRKLYITTQDLTITYDGNIHVQEEFSEAGTDGISYLHNAIVVNNTEIKDVIWDNGEVSSIDNRLEIKIWSEGDAVYVTSNYIIDYTYGKLKVLPIQITIQTGTSTHDYDGQWYSDSSFELISGNLADGENLIVDEDNSTRIRDVIREDGDASKYVGVENRLSLDIFSGADKTSENYIIEYSLGKITILPLTVDLTTESEQFVFDGDEHFNESIIESPLIAATDRFDVYQNTKVREVVRVLNEDTGLMEIASTPNVLLFRIMNGDDDVTHCYNINLTYGELSVIPCEITIQSHSAQFDYDGTPKSKPSFDESIVVIASSHEIRVATYTEVTNVCRRDGAVDGEVLGVPNDITVRIWSGSDEKTNNYIIAYVPGTITINPRSLTVTTDDGKWEYDNTTKTQQTATANQLVSGHTLKAIGPFVSITEVSGISQNIFSVSIWDSEEENACDVSGNYNISYVYGTLEITPKPISITSESFEWDYDGNIYSHAVYQLDDENALIEGHVHILDSFTSVSDVKRNANGSVGSVNNDITIKIFEGEREVSHNYKVTCNSGKFTIKPIELKITTHSGEWVYNGNSRYIDTYTHTDGELLDGHSLNLISYTTMRDVSWQNEQVSAVENILTFRVQAGLTDKTHNYDIIFENGTLKITPLAITITTASNEWMYDGQWHSDNDYSSSVDLGTGDELVVDKEFRVKDVTRDATNNIIGVDNEYEFVIKTDTADATKNYDITIIYGKLKITPRTIHVKPDDATKVYDGTPLTASEHEILASGDGLINGHVVVVEFGGSQTDVGIGASTITKVEIFDGSEDVSKNYSVITTQGELEVKRRSIVIVAGNASKVYDGIALTSSEYTVTGNGILDGHYLQAVTDGSQTEIGTSANRIVSHEILDGDGVDVSGNYDVTYEGGELTVCLYEIVLVTFDKSKVYDGEPLSFHEYYIHDSLPEGYTAHIFDWASQINVGTSSNIASIRIENELGEDVTNLFNIHYEFGVLTIFKDNDEDGGFSGSKGGNIDLEGKLSSSSNSSKKESDGDGEPLFYATSDTSGLVYFRVKSFGDYIKNGWADANSYTGGEFNALMLAYYALLENGANTSHVDVSVNSATLSYLLPYYAADGYNSLSDVMVSGSGLTSYGFDYIPYQYDYNSIPLITDSTIKEFEALYYQFVLDNYLQLPADTRSELLSIAAANGLDAANPSVISDVIDFVQNKVAYDRKSYNFVGDVALYFFNEAETAICQHYATAATAMLRALNIPARYTIGFVSSLSAGKSTPVFGDSAHAWVEVYVSGMGWVQIEVTGGGEGNPSSGGGSGSSGGLNLDGSIDKTPDEDDEEQELITLFDATASESGMVYFRVKSFGDYVVDRGWAEAKSYNSMGINPLRFSYLALKNGGRSERSLLIKPIADELDYLLPYYASNGYANTSDVQVTSTSASYYNYDYIAYNYNSSTFGFSLEGTTHMGLESEYHEYVINNYLGLPDATRLGLDAIAAANGLDSDSPTIISDVTTFVQNKVSYSKEYQEYEDDIALYFFNEAQTGICQHYATAATAMFRALGIPARYTIGYVGSLSANQAVSINAAQAHAWVEVYIDGFGWLQVEVTGNGDGNPANNASNSTSPTNLDRLVIKPVDVYKEHDGTAIEPSDFVEGYDLADVKMLKALLDAEHYYKVTADGSQTEVGTSESIITGFLLYDKYGRNVTEDFNIEYVPGSVRIIKTPIYINLFDMMMDYDGTTHSYAEDDYWEEGLPEGYTLDFKLVGSITESGMLQKKELEKLPFIVYDEHGQDVTYNFSLVFKGDTIQVEKRKIEIISGSAKRDYNGQPLELKDAWLSKGSLVSGHTFEAIITASIIDVGTMENKIQKVIICDEYGNDVSNNYEITTISGTLTVERP